MASTSTSQSKVPQSIADGMFAIGTKLGSGCFGEVYRATNTTTNEVIAVKFEDASSSAPQLEHEATILHLLQRPLQPQGFAECIYFGREGNFLCLGLERLGSSLEDHLQECEGRFSAKTTVLVGEQVLRRIEYLHSRGVVHKDIKPENFMCGVEQKRHHLYMIDFGLSKRYFDRRHISQSHRLSLTGTARYASINAHRGSEQSRRDDLEAVGHMLVYFLRGSLPWSGLAAKNKHEKYRKIMQKKESTDVSELCAGFPAMFERFLSYARNLKFAERPDYGMLRKLFSDERMAASKLEGHVIEDHELEWLANKDLGVLVKIDPVSSLKQPDDVEAPDHMRRICCFLGQRQISGE